MQVLCFHSLERSIFENHGRTKSVVLRASPVSMTVLALLRQAEHALKTIVSFVSTQIEKGTHPCWHLHLVVDTDSWHQLVSHVEAGNVINVCLRKHM